MYKILMTLALFIVLLSCSPPEEPAKKIEILRVGVVPDESKERLKQRHQGLIDHLSKQLGLPVELVIPNEYEELVDLIGEQTIDLAYFGGVTFIHAYEKYGVIPIVMRDIDRNLSTYFIARHDFLGNEIEDFKNSRLSFGNRLSMSGYFMPLYFLNERGIKPLEFFSDIQYSESHDANVYKIRDDKVDLIAVNSKVVKSMIADGRASEKDMHFIWESPSFADYVWGVRHDLGSDMTDKITNVFLSLSPAESEHIQILKEQRAGGFLPASLSDFSHLAEAMNVELKQ